MVYPPILWILKVEKLLSGGMETCLHDAPSEINKVGEATPKSENTTWINADI